MTSLIEHIEAYIGKIDSGWTNSKSITIAKILNKPQPGVATYITLGLSDDVVSPSDATAPFRQELLLSVRETFDPDGVGSFLLSFAEYVEERKWALERGMVIGPSTPLVKGSNATAIYIAAPVFFEEEFEVYTGSFPPTAFVSLIPLPAEDASYVRRHGWEAFEDLLDKIEVDVWDLDRRAIGDSFSSG